MVLRTPGELRPLGDEMGTRIVTAELLAGNAGMVGMAGTAKTDGVPAAVQDSMDAPNALSSVDVIGVVDVADNENVSELIASVVGSCQIRLITCETYCR